MVLYRKWTTVFKGSELAFAGIGTGFLLDLDVGKGHRFSLSTLIYAVPFATVGKKENIF